MIAGDSNMSEYISYVKVGATVALLQMLEDDVVFRDLSLENPIRAIRESPTTSHVVAGSDWPTAGNCRPSTSSGVSRAGHAVCASPGISPQVQSAVAMWEHLLTGLEKDPLSLRRECDWVMKQHLIEEYAASRQLALSDPRLAMLDLAYHDVSRQRGLYYLVERRGLMDRVVTDEDIERALVQPPQTTMARLRGEFIKAAKEHNRDFTVDWVHLKLNDQAQRTVLCKDPFRAVDDRVDKLIASL